LLRESLSARRKNINIAREIDEGAEIADIARKYHLKRAKHDLQLQFEQRWWLEKLFDRIHLTYVRGTILVYVLVVIVIRSFFLPYVLPSGEASFKFGYFATYIGDMFVIFALLFVHVVQKGLVNLGKQVNDSLKSKRYVSPLILLKSEDGKPKNKEYLKIDECYRDFYIKPVFCKTLQTGFDLAFDKKYQLGCGIAAAGFYLVLMSFRHVFNVLPIDVFAIWAPIPEIALAWSIYTVFMISFLWFIVGGLSWTLFIVYMIIIQVSGNTLAVRPFESTKEYFDPVTTLALKTSFTVTALAGWFSPYMLLLSALPPDPIVRESLTNFLRSLLIIMIPIIVISLIVPVLKIHRGMDGTRDRALFLKLSQLEKLKQLPLTDLDKHLEVQQHLIEDYKSISEAAEWPLNIGQTAQVIFTIALPIITYLISRSLGG
jgi:hypothetical protein